MGLEKESTRATDMMVMLSIISSPILVLFPSISMVYLVNLSPWITLKSKKIESHKCIKLWLDASRSSVVNDV